MYGNAADLDMLSGARTKARLANFSSQPRPFEGRKARRMNQREGAADGLSPNRPGYYERLGFCGSRVVSADCRSLKHARHGVACRSVSE